MGGTHQPARRIHLELDDLDFDVVPCGVVRSHRAIDAAARVESAVHVFQEIRGGDGRVHRVDFDLDRAFSVSNTTTGFCRSAAMCVVAPETSITAVTVRIRVVM